MLATVVVVFGFIVFPVQTPANSYERLVSDYQFFESVVRRETENIRQRIFETWGDRMVTSNRRWVKYYQTEEGMNIRGSYHFYTGEFLLELMPAGELTENELNMAVRNYMRRVFLLNFKTVYNNSPHGAAERVMHASGKDFLAGDLRENTLSELITGEDRLAALKSIDALISEMLYDAAKAESVTSAGRKVYSLRFYVSPKGLESDINEYREIIAGQAESTEYFDENILKAIAQVESGFNPTARSHASAYGLMQIVPHSAGIEISKALYGKPVMLLPSYFFDVNNNVQAGLTYLLILNNHYFSDIYDPVSRLYCVISAYNGGAATVARAFVGTKNIEKAVQKINTMTSEEVYKTLTTRLPYKETREYLVKVLATAEY